MRQFLGGEQARYVYIPVHALTDIAARVLWRLLLLLRRRLEHVDRVVRRHGHVLYRQNGVNIAGVLGHVVEIRHHRWILLLLGERRHLHGR